MNFQKREPLSGSPGIGWKATVIHRERPPFSSHRDDLVSP